MSISLHDECLQLDQQVSVFLKSLRNFDSESTSDNELNSVDEESSSEYSPIILKNKKSKRNVIESDSEDSPIIQKSKRNVIKSNSDSNSVYDDESNKNHVLKHGMNSGSIKLNNNGAIVKLPCGRHSGLAKTGTKLKKTKKQKDDDNTLFYKKINKNIKGKKYALLLSSKSLDETKLSKYGFKIIESLKLIENINTPNSVNNSKEYLTLICVKDENENIYKEKFSVFKKSILNKEPNTLRNKPEIIEQILNKNLATEEMTLNMSSIFNIFKNTYEKKKNINEETTFYCPIGVSEKFASTNNRNPENKLATSTITGLYYKGRKYKLNSEANFVLRDIDFDLNLNKTKSNNHIRHCVHPFYIQKLTEAFI